MRAAIDQNRQVPENDEANVASLLLREEGSSAREERDALGDEQNVKEELVVGLE